MISLLYHGVMILARAAQGCLSRSRPKTWRNIRLPDGYSVDFPGKPKSRVNGDFRIFYVDLPAAEVFLACSHRDLDDSLGEDAILQFIGDAVIKQHPKLIDRRAELLGYPVREFAFIENERNVMHWNLVLVGTRCFQLGVCASRSRYEKGAEDRRRFFESFRLTAR